MQDRAVTGTSEDTYLFNLDHFTLAYESKALPEDRARLPDGSEDGKEGIKKTHLAINAFRTGAISGQACPLHAEWVYGRRDSQYPATLSKAG